MLDWNPALYRRFEGERTRPARDLLAGVPLDPAAVASAVDLGCGPGNSTELLVRHFPNTRVIGLDHSEAMLQSARERLPAARFELGDIASWAPVTPPDLIYANASLQWVPDHARLLPRLFNMLAPGGVLALQMPDNRDEPTHRLMREVAAEAPWAGLIGDFSRFRTDLLGVQGYYDLLAPLATQIDVWRTTYHHPLASAAAIVDWVRATGLKPFVDRLPADLQASYLAQYERRIDDAYPPRGDGHRLLAFPRLFIVARRPS